MISFDDIIQTFCGFRSQPQYSGQFFSHSQSPFSIAGVLITPFDPVGVNAADPAAALKVRIVNVHEDDPGDCPCEEVHKVLANVNGDVVGVQETHVD